jgi:soluble lytic murein transglycosylase-like protein
MVSGGIIRPLLIVAVIWSVTSTSRNNGQKVTYYEIPTTLDLAAETEQILPFVSVRKTGQIPPSFSGRKAERLYHKFIIQTAGQYQIDPALIKAIILAESGYNPKAVSQKGAKGLMQLMPGTAEELGVEDIFNPQQNITGGIQYFKHLVNRFNGDVKLALAAYNAGSRHVRNYNGVPPFKATQYYVKKVLTYYQRYKSQMTGEIDRV